jgi:hypothetical protein
MLTIAILTLYHVLYPPLKRDTLIGMEEDTICYTYKVEMIIHLLSDSEPKAAETLEKNGGYVSSRKVTLIDSVPLIKG